MTESQLKRAKEDIREFHGLLEDIIDHWKDGSPHYVTLGVLVQNAGFSGTDTHNYSHYNAEARLTSIMNIIKEMKKYHKDDHVIDYTFSELEFAIMGAVHMNT